MKRAQVVASALVLLIGALAGYWIGQRVGERANYDGLVYAVQLRECGLTTAWIELNGGMARLLCMPVEWR